MSVGPFDLVVRNCHLHIDTPNSRIEVDLRSMHVVLMMISKSTTNSCELVAGICH